MRAGTLRHSIDIEELTVTADAIGGQVETWGPFATVKAQWEPLSGREYFAAQQLNTEISTRFRIRYRDDLNVKMRIRFAGQYYDILSIVPADQRGRELHILCKSP